MNVKPLKLNFTTAREIAEYYFNREFQSIPLSLIEQKDGVPYEIMYPSDTVIAEDYLDAYNNEQELVEEYLSEDEDLPKYEDWDNNDKLNFLEWVAERSEFDDYKWGDWSDNNYPMWGYGFICPDFYVNSDYMNVDKLKKMGIGVLEYEDLYVLYISGAGYDFYDAHWIPLFKELRWIEEIK